MQREAARIDEQVSKLAGKRAELAAKMAQGAELLASPDLLLDHPELIWEKRASQETFAKLGIALKHFHEDMRLTDFK